MSEPTKEWELDDHGRHRLYVGGECVGLVCPRPHHPFGGVMVVWDGNHCLAPSVDEGKSHLERLAFGALDPGDFAQGPDAPAVVPVKEPS